MTEEIEQKEECCKNLMRKQCRKNRSVSCGNGAIYGFGVIGALFYFLQNAASFGEVLIGIGKSFFWPAFMVFKLLAMLKI